jgi:hypothetical protein
MGRNFGDGSGAGFEFDKGGYFWYTSGVKRREING